ncbi:MAG: 6-phospho-beta-glucosidase [Anaerolineae bacterium]|nr:6-phospho-beta-glucosidase [Anaerolineae bacterium]
MKLTIIGGGGVRSPFMIAGLVHYAPRIGLQEVWLMDIDAAKLGLIGKLCRALAERHNAPFALHFTTDARAALAGAGHVITAMRPGDEAGRVKDERIALRRNVIGQETTGPGGFAMAMRSIPAILDYCKLIEEVAPGAWLHNFTNPAGLVTQALHDAGYTRVLGICDSANSAQNHTAGFLGVQPQAVETEVFGLNHLSWTRSAVVDGVDRLPALLRDPDYVNSSHLHIFDAALRAQLGMYLNEYLHYYYYRDEALAALQSKEETRGEQIERLTRTLLDELRKIDDPHEALRAHARIMAARSATYMKHADKDADTREDVEPPQSESSHEEYAFGYAGVALECIAAIDGDKPHRTGLNVPNAGAIDGMRGDDVVEVTCIVDGGGAHPQRIGAVPEHQYLLMRSVKRYERLAAEAILKRDRALAVEALFEHPLVGSFPLAAALVDDYLEAHGEYVGEWT